MNTTTALSILKQACLQKHVLITRPMPASHGDPGGWPYAAFQCEALTLDMGCNITAVDESKCNCGAAKNNFMCREALAALETALTRAPEAQTASIPK